MTRCKVCDHATFKAVVNAALDAGVTNAGIVRDLAEVGWDIQPETIGRHREHYMTLPTKPKGTSKKDFAIKVRDKADALLESEALDLTNKDHVAGINAGLKAQALIDRREVAKKVGGADVLVALLRALNGDPQPLQLDDGMTFEGTFTDPDAPDAD